MNTLTLGLNDNELSVIIVGMSILGAIVMFGIVFGTLRRVLVKRQSEMTRRELAAYVAEGSITPDDAERLLKADIRGGCPAALAERLTDLRAASNH
jgi:hypothetical protein